MAKSEIFNCQQIQMDGTRHVVNTQLLTNFNCGVYETSISDFHKLTSTVLKTYFQRAKPKIIK